MTEAQANQKLATSPDRIMSPDQMERKLAKAVERASRAFMEKNLRFTRLRRDVFEEIAATHASIGAYDILARLAAKGTRLAPISVYRAIDALLEAGVVHRLESKHAFFACRRVDYRAGRRSIFLACEKCDAVQEVDSDGIFETIDHLSRAVSFQPRVKFVEVSGLCVTCQSSGKD